MYSMAVTKDSLLQYFKTLDVSVLQRLQKYAQLLIIPDEDLLVNATMSQMVDKAHSLADALFPTWTDRSKSDFGEFLVELFALYSEKDFWYINALANESILRKMRSYGNAFSKASTMGYKVTLCKGSSADFSVTFSAGELVTYQRGDLVVKVNNMENTYQKLPATSDIADFGPSGIVISSSREAMNAEVLSLKTRSTDAINSIDYHRGIIEGCESILSSLNPEYAERQQQAAEINDLKAQLSELMEINRNLLSRLDSGLPAK